MAKNLTLIRVFEIPPPDARYCFGGGKLMNFVEIDWFHDISQLSSQAILPSEARSITDPDGPAALTEMIKEKNYYDPNKAYLVLCPLHSFTINYYASRDLDP